MTPLREKRACVPATNHLMAPGGGADAPSDPSGPTSAALLTRELPSMKTVLGPWKRTLPLRPTRTLQKW